MDEEVGIASLIGTVLISVIVGILTVMICCIQKKPESNPQQDLQNLQYRIGIPIALAARSEDMVGEIVEMEPVEEPEEVNLKPTSSQMKNLRANDIEIQKIKFTKPYIRENFANRGQTIKIIQINSKDVRMRNWDIGLVPRDERELSPRSKFRSANKARLDQVVEKGVMIGRNRSRRYTENPLKIYPYAPAVLLHDEESSKINFPQPRKSRSTYLGQ